MMVENALVKAASADPPMMAAREPAPPWVRTSSTSIPLAAKMPLSRAQKTEISLQSPNEVTRTVVGPSGAGASVVVGAASSSAMAAASAAASWA